MGASVHKLSKSKFQLCPEITLMINSNFWTFQFPIFQKSNYAEKFSIIGIPIMLQFSAYIIGFLEKNLSGTRTEGQGCLR